MSDHHRTDISRAMFVPHEETPGTPIIAVLSVSQQAGRHFLRQLTLDPHFSYALVCRESDVRGRRFGGLIMGPSAPFGLLDHILPRLEQPR